jgi:protein involved in polysaccharide export with SLBB domain
MSTTPKWPLGRLPLVAIALALHSCSTTTPPAPGPVDKPPAASSETSSGPGALAGEQATAGANLPGNSEKPPTPHNGSSPRIAPNDLVKIEVAHADELSAEGRVSEKGTILMPLIGEVDIGGLAPREAEGRIADILGRDYLQDPRVRVSVVGPARHEME